MPRFDVPEVQSIAGAVSGADRAAFDSSIGLAETAKAVGSIGDALKVKADRDASIKIEQDTNDLTIQYAEMQQDLQQEYSDGDGYLEAFQEKSSERQDEYLANYSGRHASAARARFEKLRTSMHVSAISKQAALKGSAIKNTAVGQLDIYKNQVERGNLDYEIARENVRSTYESLKGYNPNAAAAYLQLAEDQIGQAEIRNTMGNGGYDEVMQRINDGEFDFMSSDILAREKVKANATVKAAAADAADTVQQALVRGAPSNIDLDSHIIDVESIGDSDLAKKLKEIQGVQQSMSSFVDMGLTDQGTVMSFLNTKLQSGDITSSDLVQLNAFGAHLDYKNKMLKSDMYQYYTGIGVIDEELIPISAASPETMEEAFAQRRKYQQIVFDKDGVILPMLTNGEVISFKNMMSKSSPEMQVSVMDQMSDVMSVKDIKSTATQLSKKGADLLASTLLTARYDKQLARDLITGPSRQIPMPEKSEFIEAFASSSHGAVDFPGKTQESIINAAMAAYQARADGTNKSFQNDVFKEVMQGLVGSVVNLPSNSKTINYRDPETGQFVDPDVIEKTMKRATTADLVKAMGDSPVDANGNPINMATFSRFAQLTPVSDGQYLIRKSFGPDTGILVGGKVDANGKPLPYIIDMHKLSTAVFERGDPTFDRPEGGFR